MKGTYPWNNLEPLFVVINNIVDTSSYGFTFFYSLFIQFIWNPIAYSPFFKKEIGDLYQHLTKAYIPRAGVRFIHKNDSQDRSHRLNDTPGFAHKEYFFKELKLSRLSSVWSSARQVKTWAAADECADIKNRNVSLAIVKLKLGKHDLWPNETFGPFGRTSYQSSTSARQGRASWGS